MYRENIISITKERDDYKGQIETAIIMGRASTNDITMTAKTPLIGPVLEMLGKLKMKDDELKMREGELNDKISVQSKWLRFRGIPYNFGEKILFIPYKGKDHADNMELNDSLTYSLKRLVDLVLKYDFGVKLKLVGECNSHGDIKKTRQNSINRAENLKTHLKCNPYNLDESFFTESPQDGVSDKIAGVSICIVRK